MTIFYIIKSKLAILQRDPSSEFKPVPVKTWKGSESCRPEKSDYVDLDGRFFVVELRVWAPSEPGYQWDLSIYGHWLRESEV